MDLRKMSVSMIVDTKSSNTRLLSSRRPRIWIPDHRVTSCFECGSAFTLIRRRHHCRFCGRIFCSYCTSFTAYHASFHKMERTPMRSCRTCASESSVEENNKGLMVALFAMPLTIEELWKISMVSKRWCSVWKSFTRIRSLQYQLPSYSFRNLEKTFLLAHEAEFFYHNKWHMVFLHAIGRHPKPTNIATSCEKLMCMRECKPVLSDNSILQIVVHHPDIYINFTDNMEWMIPWWVRSGRLVKSIPCLVECNIQKKSRMYRQIYNSLNPEQRLKWERVKIFYKSIRDIAFAPSESRRRSIIHKLFTTGARYPYPWSSSFVVGMDVTQMHVLSSYTKPVVIPFLFSDGNKRLILIKPEDVRNDRLAQNVGMLIERIANVPVITYNVTAVSEDCGMIEIMPKTDTLYNITHVRNTSLLNHILAHNGNDSVDTVRSRFIDSVAVSCVMTYIMGVGDRHQENILCRSDGCMFHIDYGYILGEDPHGAPCEIRITKDILDALGGMGSASFKTFEERCKSIYSKVRRCSPLWYSIFYHLGPNKVSKWVSERLVPGEWDSEACTQIIDVVKRNSKGSWVQSALDVSHMLKNVIKNTISAPKI